jgi:hypothetical protein
MIISSAASFANFFCRNRSNACAKLMSRLHSSIRVICQYITHTHALRWLQCALIRITPTALSHRVVL